MSIWERFDTSDCSKHRPLDLSYARGCGDCNDSLGFPLIVAAAFAATIAALDHEGPDGTLLAIGMIWFFGFYAAPACAILIGVAVELQKTQWLAKRRTGGLRQSIGIS